MGPKQVGWRTRWRIVVVAAAIVSLGATAGTEPEAPVRVATSGDYPPFSEWEGPGGTPEGFDAALLRSWAEERGRELVFVRFHWPRLLEDLEAGRFDVAASGITVRPERSAAGRFTHPLVETSAWLLARTPSRWDGLPSFDRPQIRVAVNAGGHLEQVAERLLPRASRLVVPDNAAVLRLLAEEKVHAVVTDSVEIPIWEERIEIPVKRIGPLSRDRKAWLVAPDQPDLAADLDAWLLAREADGSLARWRQEWFEEAGPETAHPLDALWAAMDERLAMMPLVGAVKRRSGRALVVPSREERVLEAAVAEVERAAKAAGRGAPPEAEVRAFFRVQIDTAVDVQRAAVRDASYQPASLPDLDEALRPGLLRLGSRIAALLVALPSDLDRTKAREQARASLRAPYLEDRHRVALADAVVRLARSRAEGSEGEDAPNASGSSQ